MLIGRGYEAYFGGKKELRKRLENEIIHWSKLEKIALSIGMGSLGKKIEEKIDKSIDKLLYRYGKEGNIKDLEEINEFINKLKEGYPFLNALLMKKKYDLYGLLIEYSNYHPEDVVI